MLSDKASFENLTEAPAWQLRQLSEHILKKKSQSLKSRSNCYRNISEGITNFEFTEGFQMYALSEARGLSSEDKREYRMITLP